QGDGRDGRGDARNQGGPLHVAVVFENAPGAAERGSRFHGRPRKRRRDTSEPGWPGRSRRVPRTPPMVSNRGAVRTGETGRGKVTAGSPARKSGRIAQAKSRSSNRIRPTSSAIAVYIPA